MIKFRFACLPIPGAEEYEISLRRLPDEGFILAAADPMTREIVSHLSSLTMRGELDAVLRIHPTFALLIHGRPLQVRADPALPSLLDEWRGQAGAPKATYDIVTHQAEPQAPPRTKGKR